MRKSEGKKTVSTDMGDDIGKRETGGRGKLIDIVNENI